MRLAILVPLSFVFGTASVAQDAMDRVAEATSTCATAIDTSLSKAEIQAALGVCMIQSTTPYKKELKRKFGFDLDHFDQDPEAFGKTIGIRMAARCPAFFTLLARKDKSPPSDVPPPPPGLSVSGKLVTVKSGQFLTLVILAQDGRTLELLLLGQAQKVDGILRSQDQGRGTTGEWHYRADELFDPLSRTYRPYYVVTGFEAK